MQETPVQFLGWEDRLPITVFMGFSGGSDGKKSACNAGDLGSVPGLGRSPGEGIGYPLQYLWTSLVAQMVKNLPAMKETWIQSLGWEDPMEEGMPSHPLFLPGEFHGQRSLAGYSPWGHKESNMTEWLRTHTHTLNTKAGLWMKTLQGEAFSWVTASSKTHCVFLALRSGLTRNTWFH